MSSSTLDALKSERAQMSPTRTGLGEKEATFATRAGNGKQRRILFASLPAMCALLLIVWFCFLHSRSSNHSPANSAGVRPENSVKAQAALKAKKLPRERRNAKMVFPAAASGPERYTGPAPSLEPEGENDRSALIYGNPPRQLPEPLDESPGLERQRSIRQRAYIAPGQSEARANGDMRPNVRLSRSEARRITLAGMVPRLPQGYGRDSGSEASPGEPGISVAPGGAAAIESQASGKLDAPPPANHAGTISSNNASQSPANKAAEPVRTVNFNDLPYEMRQSISISISMLVYSKAETERWVLLNGSKMHEGESNSAGLKLEEITPDGGIFSYQGFRFFKPVKG